MREQETAMNTSIKQISDGKDGRIRSVSRRPADLQQKKGASRIILI